MKFQKNLYCQLNHKASVLYNKKSFPRIYSIKNTLVYSKASITTQHQRVISNLGQRWSFPLKILFASVNMLNLSVKTSFCLLCAFISYIHTMNYMSSIVQIMWKHHPHSIVKIQSTFFNYWWKTNEAYSIYNICQIHLNSFWYDGFYFTHHLLFNDIID